MEAHEPIVRTRVPLRISFGGGGTDVEPYVSQHGGATLSATITRYVHSSVSPRNGPHIHLESQDLNQISTFQVQDVPMFDGKLDLIKAVLLRINPDFRQGLHMRLQSDAPPGSGLGASSALVVAAILSMARLLGVYLTSADTAKLAYQIERNDLGIMGGYQDQYAAAYGGFNWTEYTAEGAFVAPLGLSRDVLMELEYNCLLWYTGETHTSGGILKEQISNYQTQAVDVLAHLQALKDIAVEMRAALQRGRLDDFGDLLDQTWQQKKRLASKISSDYIDTLYTEARKAGALGGKVLGAGGGGYLLVYAPEKRRPAILGALSQVGGSNGGPLHFDLSGPVTWTSRRMVARPYAFRMS